jgi:hypothetical protein
LKQLENGLIIDPAHQLSRARRIFFSPQEPRNRESRRLAVNSTHIPGWIGNRYDELWTEARMRKLIDAFARHRVAVEIKDVRRFPRAEFIKKGPRRRE